MRFLQKILSLSKYQIGFQFFSPILLATLLYFLGLPLIGFIVFQLFIEVFVLWHFAIGLNLSQNIDNQKFIKIFVFNMLFALLYRFSGNVYQIWYASSFGVFPAMEEILWLIPIHIYASFGSVYCFYLNARWICETEIKLNLNSNKNLRNTFFQILLFPYGLWYIQPRLNKIAQELASLKPNLGRLNYESI